MAFYYDILLQQHKVGLGLPVRSPPHFGTLLRRGTGSPLAKRKVQTDCFKCQKRPEETSQEGVGISQSLGHPVPLRFLLPTEDMHLLLLANERNLKVGSCLMRLEGPIVTQERPPTLLDKP